MEQGPVLIITFQTQQIMVAHNAKGEVVEGDAVCRHSFELFTRSLAPLCLLGKSFTYSLCLGSVSGSIGT